MFLNPYQGALISISCFSSFCFVTWFDTNSMPLCCDSTISSSWIELGYDLHIEDNSVFGTTWQTGLGSVSVCVCVLTNDRKTLGRLHTVTMGLCVVRRVTVCPYYSFKYNSTNGLTNSMHLKMTKTKLKQCRKYNGSIFIVSWRASSLIITRHSGSIILLFFYV